MAEDSCDIDGILVLLNTMGGDVEAGLAIAEMIASISKPTVSDVYKRQQSVNLSWIYCNKKRHKKGGL